MIRYDGQNSIKALCAGVYVYWCPVRPTEGSGGSRGGTKCSPWRSAARVETGRCVAGRRIRIRESIRGGVGGPESVRYDCVTKSSAGKRQSYMTEDLIETVSDGKVSALAAPHAAHQTRACYKILRAPAHTLFSVCERCPDAPCLQKSC